MKDDNENINFELMPDFGKILSSEDEMPKEEPIVVEKEYDSLYEELKDKCNPSNFMNPYVLERFNIANEIYSQILSVDNQSDDAIIYLRNRCINELGIPISTKKLYEYLFSVVNPKIFIKENHYDAEKVKKAGALYDLLLKNKNDILALEQLEIAVQEFIKDNEVKNFVINDEENYESTLPSKEEINEANKQLEYDYEESYFNNYSANYYLEKYPDGIYAEEAKFFLHHEMNEYLQKYPKGRYAYNNKTADKEVVSSDWIAISILVLIGIIVIINNI